MEQDDTEEMNLAVLCRLCATHSERMVGIYSDEGLGTELATKVNLHLPVKVSEADVLPLQCCEICTSTVLTWHNLVSSCVEAEQRLKDLLSEKTEKDNTYVDMEPDTEPDQPDIMEDTMEEDVEVPETINITQESNEEIFPFDTDIKCEEKFQENTDLLHRCELCAATFKTMYRKIQHVKRDHHHPAKLKISTTERRRSARKPIQSRKAAKVFPCELCECVFYVKKNWRKHMNTEHKVKEEKVVKTKEVVEDIDCSNDEELEPSNEKRIAFAEKYSELVKRCCVIDAFGKKVYKCDREHCRSVFRYPSLLIQHLTVHTGEKPYFCHICGKSFRIASGLRTHVNEYHLKIKNYPCDVCGFKFTSRSFRDEHMNTHTDNRPYVCDVCGKAFRQSGSLYVHKLFHSNVFKFECDKCDKKFRRATELKIHNRKHTGEKPFVCSQCDAAFIDNKGLRIHVTIHDTSTLYSCNLCGNEFKQERYLKNHLRNHRKKAMKLEETIKAGEVKREEEEEVGHVEDGVDQQESLFLESNLELEEHDDKVMDSIMLTHNSMKDESLEIKEIHYKSENC